MKCSSYVWTLAKASRNLSESWKTTLSVCCSLTLKIQLSSAKTAHISSAAVASCMSSSLSSSYLWLFTATCSSCSWESRTDWKHLTLEVDEIDEWDVRDALWATDLLCRVTCLLAWMKRVTSEAPLMHCWSCSHTHCIVMTHPLKYVFPTYREEKTRFSTALTEAGRSWCLTDQSPVG